MKDNKEIKINKPIHQEDRNKVLVYIDELDKGKLALGIGALVVGGGYLYPTVFTATNIAMVTGGLVKVGIGAIGAICGALAIDIGIKAHENKDVVQDSIEIENLEEEK